MGIYSIFNKYEYVACIKFYTRALNILLRAIYRNIIFYSENIAYSRKFDIRHATKDVSYSLLRYSEYLIFLR